MKQSIKTFARLAILFFLLSSLKPGLPNHVASKSDHCHKAKGNGVLLVYIGNLESPQAPFDQMGVRIEMEPSIGLRYEWTFERADNVVSHGALFYKFSKPNQTIIYNFLTHDVEINSGGNDKGAGSSKVEVVGSEAVGKYACTHLQDIEKNTNSVSRTDYWMAGNIPGFKEIISALNKANAGMNISMLDASVFNWGGLAKWKYYGEDKKSGMEISADLNLAEANPNMDFPTKDFEVPGK